MYQPKIDQAKKTPSVERLKELFEVTPEGHLLRKLKSGIRGAPGSIVKGFKDKKGKSLLVKIDNKQAYKHRVIFAMTNGYYTTHVGFRNGDKHDTRPDNLFDCSTKIQYLFPNPEELNPGCERRYAIMGKECPTEEKKNAASLKKLISNPIVQCAKPQSAMTATQHTKSR